MNERSYQVQTNTCTNHLPTAYEHRFLVNLKTTKLTHFVFISSMNTQIQNIRFTPVCHLIKMRAITCDGIDRRPNLSIRAVFCTRLFVLTSVGQHNNRFIRADLYQSIKLRQVGDSLRLTTSRPITIPRTNGSEQLTAKRLYFARGKSQNIITVNPVL